MISGIGQSEDNSLLQLLFEAVHKNSRTDSSNKSSSKTESANSSAENDFFSCLESNFDKIDANSDTKLSKDEISLFSGVQKQMGPPVGMFIENSEYEDNSVSEIYKDPSTDVNSIDELISKSIESMDSDDDGSLSYEEITAKNIKSDNENTPNNNLFKNLSDILTESSNSGFKEKFQELITKKASEAYSSNTLNKGIMSTVMDYVF